MLERLSESFRKRFGFNPIIPEYSIMKGSKAFELSKDLFEARFNVEPLSKGLLLASLSPKFMPTQHFLDLNKDRFTNVAVLDDRASFLFTCGRRLFRASMQTLKGHGQLYLVKNKDNEVLGLTEFKNREFSNAVNIGEYLKESKRDQVLF